MRQWTKSRCWLGKHSFQFLEVQLITSFPDLKTNLIKFSNG